MSGIFYRDALEEIDRLAGDSAVDDEMALELVRDVAQNSLRRRNVVSDGMVERAALAMCSGREHEPVDCPALPVYRKTARTALEAALRATSIAGAT